MRKLEAGLANSAMLVSDMISAGIGGNVYKRDKDTTASEANKEIARLREAQIAEDMAAKAQEQAARDKWSADYWKEWTERRKQLLHNVSEQSSEGSQQHQNTHEQVTNNSQRNTSKTTSATTYSDAMKGKGLRGHSSSVSTGSKQDGKTDYIPIRVLNGPHGYSYVSFAVSEKEKNALALAIASSVRDAAAAGDENAKMLEKVYFKSKKTGEKQQWDLDGLVNDGALYKVPGVLNRYLDELEKMGLSSNEGGVEIPYTREELYVMMTGDSNFERVPRGVILNTSAAVVAPWLQ
jgi:hypothetical protein